jgi:predicted Fe-Mo cluster-binding NifX family protein
MKVAVASMGTSPEAWVGIRFGRCSQFLVFDLETAGTPPMAYVIVSVPPSAEEAAQAEDPSRVSLAAIRAIAEQGVSVVITGHIKEICRQTLFNLGIDVIDGVEGMTVHEAVERYRATGLETPDSRVGLPTRIAVAARGEGLDAPLEIHFGVCASFILVDPLTMDWEVIQIEPGAPSEEKEDVNVESIRTVVQNGATALITPHIHPECCMALRALAVSVYLAPEGITVREAVERYEQGELEESLVTPFNHLNAGGNG